MSEPKAGGRDFEAISTQHALGLDQGTSVVTRRLATILAADAVGFSTRMETNEEGTLALLKDARQTIDAEIEHHGGRVFGSAGDSVIPSLPAPSKPCAAR